MGKGKEMVATHTVVCVRRPPLWQPLARRVGLGTVPTDMAAAVANADLSESEALHTGPGQGGS